MNETIQTSINPSSHPDDEPAVARCFRCQHEKATKTWYPSDGMLYDVCAPCFADLWTNAKKVTQ